MYSKQSLFWFASLVKISDVSCDDEVMNHYFHYLDMIEHEAMREREHWVLNDD